MLRKQNKQFIRKIVFYCVLFIVGKTVTDKMNHFQLSLSPQ